MWQHRKSLRLVTPISLFIVGLWLVIGPPTAAGHNGGEPRLVDVEAGDFRLSVWTLPVPLQAGEVNFIAFVAEAVKDNDSFVRANTPVLDADIKFIFEPVDGGEPLIITSDHERATNKLFYESYFELLEHGAYEAVISVEKDGRMGEASFDFEVARGALQINWFRYSGFALMAVVVGWFVWQIRQERRLREVVS